MKKFRKLLAMLMALCALCSVLAGCGLMEDVNDLQDALEQKEQEEAAGLNTEPAETEKTKETDPPVETTEPPVETTEPPTETTEAPTEEDTQPLDVSYYLFFDYENAEFLQSDVLTYQTITGVSCELSSYDWGFLEEDYSDMVVGYDEYRGVFIYAYDWESLDLYFEYLESIGFTAYLTQEYKQGTSYYYVNETTGFFMDIFVVSDSSYVAIEPYLNADPA